MIQVKYPSLEFDWAYVLRIYFSFRHFTHIVLVCSYDPLRPRPDLPEVAPHHVQGVRHLDLWEELQADRVSSHAAKNVTDQTQALARILI